ncbi:MAG: hypothetical protein ACFFC3_00670 [Candidatus Odinarchaeota archaeon]
MRNEIFNISLNLTEAKDSQISSFNEQIAPPNDSPMLFKLYSEKQKMYNPYKFGIRYYYTILKNIFTHVYI